MSSNPAQQRGMESGDGIISRADWRFLLPDPDPEHTLCLADGMPAETAQLFSTTTLYSGYDPGHSDYDLAVLRNPGDSELRYAMSVLKPGAACYAEWDVNALFTPGWITKKLTDAGFDNVDQYMPKPDPDTAPPGIWIPLESYGAINYVLKSYYKSQPALRYAGKMVFRALWSLQPGLFIKFPWLISSGHRRFKVCSIARKPEIEETESETNKFKSGLMEIARLLPDKNGSTRPTKLRTMIKSGGMNRLNKIILLVFSGDVLLPSYVLKIPRTDDSESALRNEAITLQALMRDCNMTKGIPRVLCADHRLGFFSVGETYIDGRVLGEVLDRKNLPGLAKKLTDWLILLARKTAAPLPEDWKSSYVNSLAEVIDAAMPNSTYGKLVSKAIDSLSGLEIPTLVCEHRDFAPWNILVTEDRQFGVLDWESSRLNGIPGLDLIYFLTYLCFYIEEAWTDEKALGCYKKMLDSDTNLGRVWNDCFNFYADVLGLPAQSAKSLRILTWITHLASVCGRMQNEEAFSGDVHHGNLSLFLSLIRYEISAS
jgi:aminoglycoside phosphotransferase (APT) family kinase protein